MSGLLITVSLLGIVAIGAAVIGKEVVRIRKEDRIQREKEKQIKVRVDRENVRRRELVLILDRTLREKLDKIDLSHGAISLSKARYVAEKVFYDWINENYHLFNICDETHVTITGIKNGSLVYELPETIKRHLRKTP